MANTRSPIPPEPEPDPQSLLAAALALTAKDDSLLYNSQVIDYLTNGVTTNSADALAWYYYCRLPELRYISRYIGNALSMATLYVGVINPEGEPTRLPADHVANEVMKDFAGGFAGQSALLDRLGLHLTIVGDSVLIGPTNGTDGGPEPFDQWRVYSTEEVSSRNGQIFVKFPGNAREIPIPPSNIAVRIWRPGPRYYWEADSPVKGSFSVLRELDLLDQHVHASAVSRLAGAGLLGIPEELDLPTGGDVDLEGTEVDRFVAMLTEIMSLAIKNRESAAALVPIILRGPAEYIDKIKHFDFATEFATQVPELRMGAIRRLALGMDVPPEILVGSASATSWSAWQIDEATLRVHLVPMLQLIASSLTVGVLRPILETMPMAPIQKEQIPYLVIGFDVSKLKIHQDISGDAEALFDRFEIDANALRQSVGYSADTAPNNEELAKQILLTLVRGNPDLASYAVNGLRENFGVTKLPPAPTAAGPGPGAPTETPSPKTPPIKGPLPGDRSQAKQVSPPPVPKVGDQNNNEQK